MYLPVVQLEVQLEFEIIKDEILVMIQVGPGLGLPVASDSNGGVRVAFKFRVRVVSSSLCNRDLSGPVTVHSSSNLKTLTKS